MRFKVPKDVDIEDRIVGPLTIKQLGWLAGGAVICILFWKIFVFQFFIFLSLVVMGLATAFAFVRPYNQSLVAFCGSVLLFLSKPKQYFWKRKGEAFPKSRNSRQNNKNLVPLVRKGFSAKEIENLAGTLDSNSSK